MKWNQDDLGEMNKRYRATFINSLAGIKTAVLVGTIGPDNITNLAIFNSLIHIGANPPMYGLLFRPDTVRRDTLNHILKTKSYTLNYMHIDDAVKAHQTSAKYESHESEFEKVGLTPIFDQVCPAPFVKEAPVKIAMQFEERVDIKSNGTILLIGKIQSIEIDQTLVAQDGFVSLDKAEILACCGLDAYYRTEKLMRLSYAKPEIWPTQLD